MSVPHLYLLLMYILGLSVSDVSTANSISFSKTPVLCPSVNSAEHIHSSMHSCPSDAFQLLLLPLSWTNLFGKFINETEYHEIATMIRDFEASPWYRRNDVHWRTVNYTIHVEGIVVRFMEIQDVSNFTNGILVKSTTVPLDLPNEEAYVQENVFCIVKYRSKYVMDVFTNFSLIDQNYASEWFANSMLNVYSRYLNTFSLVMDHYCSNPNRFWVPKLQFSYGEGPSLYTESEEHELKSRKKLTTKSMSSEVISSEAKDQKESINAALGPQQWMASPRNDTCELAKYTMNMFVFAVVVVLFLAVLTVCCTVIFWLWSRRRQLDIAELQAVVASRRSSHLVPDRENVLLSI